MLSEEEEQGDHRSIASRFRPRSHPSGNAFCDPSASPAKSILPQMAPATVSSHNSEARKDGIPVRRCDEWNIVYPVEPCYMTK
ncbi:hypothetical protein BAUCODRAFT_125311 [Baudoinia panamericana UAMH 10762]|uniref:Uncharacterized protein n=1 Tax=Baudoinia panamericana (strain UAMH 10762) TaxID=717646 RepID=M2MAF8_BAUPA|nr:uncharacterized protein BAUCODRAFT_125311 [Baudoinia panamericana UAMH 10762]EMC93456.1 hypothetical protein BAUCODRAFT_125311 [Baudoinia panamericana UAMH 10762]